MFTSYLIVLRLQWWFFDDAHAMSFYRALQPNDVWTQIQCKRLVAQVIVSIELSEVLIQWCDASLATTHVRKASLFCLIVNRMDFCG